METFQLSKNTTTWPATGAVSRTSTAPYGALVVNESVYTAHYQAPLPLKLGQAANVITRSELSRDQLAKWTYHYKESVDSKGDTNNGMYRSTSLSAKADSLWLWQPSTDKPQSWFSEPWTKASFDGYIYFGLYEWDHTTSSAKSRVARVCHTESDPPNDNNFASFVKMDIECAGGDYKIQAKRMTAVVAGANGRFYAAFTTDDAKASTPGALLCSFTYTAEPHGVDFEMGGKIDTRINQHFLFSPYSGKNFSCTRTASDARALVYVNPKAQTSDRKGTASSTTVLLELLGTGTPLAPICPVYLPHFRLYEVVSLHMCVLPYKYCKI